MKRSQDFFVRLNKSPLLQSPSFLEGVFFLSYNLEIHVPNWNKMYSLNDENKKRSK